MESNHITDDLFTLHRPVNLASCSYHLYFKFGIKYNKISLHSASQAKDLVSFYAKVCFLLYTPCFMLCRSTNLSLASAFKPEPTLRGDLTCLLTCTPDTLQYVKASSPPLSSQLHSLWSRSLHLWRERSDGLPHTRCLHLIKQELTNIELLFLALW